jgi:hypothetical protein
VLVCVGGHVIIELVVVADVEDSVWWWDNVWDLKEENKCCRSRLTIENGPCATPMGSLMTESCVRSSGDGRQSWDSWHPPHPWQMYSL